MAHWESTAFFRRGSASGDKVKFPSLCCVNTPTLASVGVFTQQSDGNFTLSPLAEPLRKNAVDSQWAMAVMMGEEHYAARSEERRVGKEWSGQVSPESET